MFFGLFSSYGKTPDPAVDGPTFLKNLILRDITAEETKPLRQSVLWPQLRISHPNISLPEDPQGTHYGAFIPGRAAPIGVLSLWTQPLPPTPGSSTSGTDQASSSAVIAVRFDKVAVDPDFQKRGVGSALLKHAFRVAREDLHAEVIWCHAGLQVVGWYQRHGLQTCAPTYIKAAGQYRVPMKLVVGNSEKPAGEPTFRSVPVEETLHLRHTVLWPGHPLSHVRVPDDDAAFHYAAFLPYQPEPVAVISLFKEPVPSIGGDEGTSSAVRFRKFACDPAHQGHGVGSALLQHAFQVARRDLGADVIWCDARRSTEIWYRKRGMVPFGPPFFKGPVEYVHMKTT